MCSIIFQLLYSGEIYLKTFICRFNVGGPAPSGANVKVNPT